MAADAGIVKTQAQTMLLAKPQRTAEVRRAMPTPTIAPVIVCVVDTGMPSQVAVNKDIAPAVSAQKPWNGLRSVIFEPMVRTIRHPPNKVPKPMATCEASTTHNGT